MVDFKKLAQKSRERRALSPEQEAVALHMATSERSLVVEAVAGSGKTSTLVESLRRGGFGRDTLLLAFNKSVQEELKKKLKGTDVKVQTMNGLGHQTLMMALKGVKMAPDKISKIRAELLTSRERYALGWTVHQVVGILKQKGICPSHPRAQSTQPWSRELVRAVAQYHGIFLDPKAQGWPGGSDGAWNRVAELAEGVLVRSLDDLESVDYNDQIFLPVVMDLYVPKYRVVVADEAQDLSLVQHRIIGKALQKDGKVIAVGDPYQSIYGWRGANSDSMQRLTERFEADRLPLSVTWRCATSIVDAARAVNPLIKARADAPVGSVRRILMGDIDVAALAPGDLVLGRTWATLLTYAFELMARGTSVRCLGKDLYAEVSPLLPQTTSGRWEHAVAHARMEIRKKLEQAPPDDPNVQRQIEELMGVVSALERFLPGAVPLAEAFPVLKQILCGDDHEEGPAVVFSSIHRAKGLEARRVLFIDEHPKNITQEWQRKEYRNVTYVAVTRAIEELTWVLPGEE